MSVRTTANNQGVVRTAGLFLNGTDFTYVYWSRYITDTGAVGKYRTLHVLGDATFATQYAWEGSQANLNDFSFDSVGTGSKFSTYFPFRVVDQWYHTAIVYDDTAKTIEVYINGYLFDTITGVDFSTTTFAAERLGYDTAGGNTDYWNMEFQYYRSWTTKLTATEIRAEMNSTTVVKTASLFVNTPLTSSTDLADLSGGGRDWSANGSISTGTSPFALPLTKQVIMNATFGANFSKAQEWMPLSGAASGLGSFWVGADAFGGMERSRVPVTTAGTFKNLKVKTYGSHHDITITVMKNGVATSIVAAVATAATEGQDITNSFEVAPGDDVCYQLDGTSESNPGFWIQLSIEFDSNATSESIYGIGDVSHGWINNTEFSGGAFGNGTMIAFTPGNPSQTYSICSAAGQITRLIAKSYLPALGAGNDAVYAMVKNGVLQDGSGGTVDTRCTLDGAVTQATSFFQLDVVPGDEIDIYAAYTGANQPFDYGYGSVACAFLPTTNGQFMICGGNNNVISTSAASQTWPNIQQLATPEDKNEIKTASAFAVIGLYVKISTGPAGVATWDYAIRKNRTDTAITLQLTGGATPTTGSIFGSSVLFNANDLIDLGIVPTGAPTSSQLHWGLLLSSLASGVGAGLYFIDPGKLQDTIYSSLSPVTTYDVKIPDPFAKTAFIGG